jgi:HSP20 family protein
MEEMIMSMIKYDPFRELRNLQDEMTRLFVGTVPRGSDEQMAHGAWIPSVDIYEDQNRLVLEADLPGLTRDDFDLLVENNVITLKGERKFEKKVEGDNYHRVERSYGSFSRSFTLPQTVTAEGATAEFENGILRVSLPKREETKARKIEISGTGSSTPKAIEAEQANKAKA